MGYVRGIQIYIQTRFFFLGSLYSFFSRNLIGPGDVIWTPLFGKKGLCNCKHMSFFLFDIIAFESHNAKSIKKGSAIACVLFRNLEATGGTIP